MRWQLSSMRFMACTKSPMIVPPRTATLRAHHLLQALLHSARRGEELTDLITAASSLYRRGHRARN